MPWLCAGSGTAWLLPLVNGAPLIGWEEASKYLVLPVLLVVAQFASSAIISPVNKDDVSDLAVLSSLASRPLQTLFCKKAGLQLSFSVCCEFAQDQGQDHVDPHLLL